MTTTDLLDGILGGLFPMYLLQSKNQQKLFKEYCLALATKHAAASLQSPTRVQALLSYFDINVLVVDENTGHLEHSQFIPQGNLVSLLHPKQVPVESKRGRRASKKKDNNTPRDILRLDRLLNREQNRIERQRRLQQFLRTGVRSEITKASKITTVETLKSMADLRDHTLPRNAKWDSLSAWHRRQLYGTYLRMSEESEQSETANVQAVRAALQSDDPHAILALPVPQYDPQQNRIKSLSPVSTEARTRPSRRKKAKATTHKRARRKKAGGVATLLAQCRRLRRENMKSQNRSVEFTGDFVA